MKKITPKHISWIVDTGNQISTANGLKAKVVEILHVPDQKIISEWAKHFREHYCFDHEIDDLRQGTGLSKADYLKIHKFPNKKIKPGPSVRSGDFAEILVADYFEFHLKHIVLRTRYRDKNIPNESVKGTDFITFVLHSTTDIGTEKYSPEDVLTAIEVKAQFSGNKAKSRLQDAVDDSAKDQLRTAFSLNAMKQRIKNMGNTEQALIVQRFQNLNDNPYKSYSVAAAFFCDSVFDKDVIQATTTDDHPNKLNLELLAFKGKKMMTLVHHLYEVAANEA